MTPSDQFADPATDADPAETRTFRPAAKSSRAFFDPAYVAPQAPPTAPTAQDGPKDPEPTTDAPEAPTASQDAPEAPTASQDAPQPAPEPLSVAYPENHATHPSRLPPAARPVRQGV